MPRKTGFSRRAMRDSNARPSAPEAERLARILKRIQSLRYQYTRAVTVAVTGLRAWAPSCLALALCAGCVAQDASAPRLPVPLVHVQPSVVQLVKGISACSGVALDGHHVLTAAHCAHGSGAFVWAMGDVGDYEAHDVLKVSRTFPGQDLLELEIAPPVSSWVWESSEPVRKGDPLQLWGFGCDPTAGTNPGPEVRAAIALSDHSATATICHGDSGGPVIGYDGVAGVMTGSRASDSYIEFEPLL